MAGPACHVPGFRRHLAVAKHAHGRCKISVLDVRVLPPTNLEPLLGKLGFLPRAQETGAHSNSWTRTIMLQVKTVTKNPARHKSTHFGRKTLASLRRGSSNELLYVNSMKMKLSVLFGVLQMTVGLLLRRVRGWLVVVPGGRKERLTLGDVHRFTNAFCPLILHVAVGQNLLEIPFWLVGEFPTHFRSYSSGWIELDVHRGYGL